MTHSQFPAQISSASNPCLLPAVVPLRGCQPWAPPGTVQRVQCVTPLPSTGGAHCPTGRFLAVPGGKGAVATAPPSICLGHSRPSWCCWGPLAGSRWGHVAVDGQAGVTWGCLESCRRDGQAGSVCHIHRSGGDSVVRAFAHHILKHGLMGPVCSLTPSPGCLPLPRPPVCPSHPFGPSGLGFGVPQTRAGICPCAAP